MRDGRDQRAAQPGQERAEHEHARVERVDVDAERAEHLAVERGGADEAADARALQHEPEGQGDGRPQQQDEAGCSSGIGGAEAR